MLNSTLAVPSSLDSFFDYLENAKDYPFELALGIMTALGARYVYKTLTRANAYSELDGPTASSFLRGNETLLFNPETSLSIHDDLLNQYGSVCKIKGPLGEDRIWIADPRAMSDIVVKGFDDFHEVEGYVAWFALTQGPTIITTTGHKHKIQRKILNPVFTAAHIRKLTPTINGIARYLEEIITSKVREGMGYSFGVMGGKRPEYIEAAHQLLPLITEMWYIRPFLPTLMKIGPARFRRFVVDSLPFGPVDRLKKVTDTMDKTASTVYNQKKLALANGTLESEIAAGNDIMSMLLKQNEVVPPEDQMTEEEIQAQVNGLLFGGLDTTSAALARILHLLAQHPDVQARLRAEIREAHGLYGKELDYDQLNSLKYLDAVCRESLRLWSPAQLTERVAGKDWNLPLKYPVKSKDGRTMISNLPIKKGTHLYLSLGSVNRDKQTWGEDADQFNPSRWLKPLSSSVTDSNILQYYDVLGWSTVMHLEMKVVLSTLISSFRLEMGPEEYIWSSAVVVKPYVRREDGTIDPETSLRMKVTLIED